MNSFLKGKKEFIEGLSAVFHNCLYGRQLRFSQGQ